MRTIIELISNEVMTAFKEAGYDENMGKVTLSNRPDLCEYQCNGAMAGAKQYHKAPIMIANEVAELWQSEYIEDLILKCREVKPLSKMKLSERRFYIENAFSVNPQYGIFGRDILLIDDIFTSGTTVKECAKVLKMYGANKVYVLCVCYD